MTVHIQITESALEYLKQYLHIEHHEEAEEIAQTFISMCSFPETQNKSPNAIIEEYRSQFEAGRNIWRRPSMELILRTLDEQQSRISDLYAGLKSIELSALDIAKLTQDNPLGSIHQYAASIYAKARKLAEGQGSKYLRDAALQVVKDYYAAINSDGALWQVAASIHWLESILKNEQGRGAS